MHLSSNGVSRTLLYSISSIKRENYEEYNRACLDNGYLIVGNGPNNIFSKLMEVAVISSLLGNARQSLIATACEYVANMALHDEMTFDNTDEDDLIDNWSWYLDSFSLIYEP